MFKFNLVIFLGFPLIFLLVVDSFPIEKQFSGICEAVLDGDTIIVARKRVRLYGIDAPEKDQWSMDHKPIGRWSKQYLKNLIEGKQVMVKWYKKGFYGRIIGVVYTDENINLRMLKAGMAIRSQFNKKNLYINTEYTARLRREGIFKTLGFVSPWYYRIDKKRPLQ